MNKKRLSGWTWFWIILFLIIVGGGGYSYYRYSGYAYDEPEPLEYHVCDCYDNVYDCEDFLTQEYAQECFEYCKKTITGGDIHHLDADNDGIACEWNN